MTAQSRKQTVVQEGSGGIGTPLHPVRPAEERPPGGGFRLLDRLGQSSNSFGGRFPRGRNSRRTCVEGLVLGYVPEEPGESSFDSGDEKLRRTGGKNLREGSEGGVLGNMEKLSTFFLRDR